LIAETSSASFSDVLKDPQRMPKADDGYLLLRVVMAKPHLLDIDRPDPKLAVAEARFEGSVTRHVRRPTKE